MLYIVGNRRKCTKAIWTISILICLICWRRLRPWSLKGVGYIFHSFPCLEINLKPYGSLSRPLPCSKHRAQRAAIPLIGRGQIKWIYGNVDHAMLAFIYFRIVKDKCFERLCDSLCKRDISLQGSIYIKNKQKERSTKKTKRSMISLWAMRNLTPCTTDIPLLDYNVFIGFPVPFCTQCM